MGSMLDDIPVHFECPNCQHEISETVGWLKSEGNHCPGCGTVFEGEALAKGLAEAEAALAKFMDALHEFGK